MKGGREESLANGGNGRSNEARKRRRSMMKPNLNRRGCLAFALLVLIVVAAILWFARVSPPQPQPRGIPPEAIDADQRAQP